MCCFFSVLSVTRDKKSSNKQKLVILQWLLGLLLVTLLWGFGHLCLHKSCVRFNRLNLTFHAEFHIDETSIQSNYKIISEDGPCNFSLSGKNSQSEGNHGSKYWCHFLIQCYKCSISLIFWSLCVFLKQHILSTPLLGTIYSYNKPKLKISDFFLKTQACLLSFGTPWNYLYLWKMNLKHNQVSMTFMHFIMKIWRRAKDTSYLVSRTRLYYVIRKKFSFFWFLSFN